MSSPCPPTPPGPFLLGHFPTTLPVALHDVFGFGTDPSQPQHSDSRLVGSSSDLAVQKHSGFIYTYSYLQRSDGTVDKELPGSWGRRLSSEPLSRLQQSQSSPMRWTQDSFPHSLPFPQDFWQPRAPRVSLQGSLARVTSCTTIAVSPADTCHSCPGHPAHPW